MLRAALAIMLIIPFSALLLASGCGEKKTTVRQTERRVESEPQMTSPGTEIVE